MARLTSLAEFARLAGVSRAAVTQAASIKPAMVGKFIDLDHPAAIAYLTKTPPAPVDLPDAEGIDELYPQALELCRRLGKVSARAIGGLPGISRSRARRLAKVIEASGAFNRPAPTTPPVAKAAPKAASPPPQQEQDQEAIIPIPPEIEGLLDLSLRELVDRYGTAVRLEKWLSAVQKIEAIREKRLDNAQLEGKLIARSLVKSALIDPLDGVFTRLLTDGAQTVAVKSHAIAAAGGTVAEVKAMAVDLFGAFIAPVKKQMAAKCWKQ